MDIDEIFKRPPLPKSAVNPNKRKLDAPTFDPESYKTARLDTPAGPAATARTRGGVTIEDVRDEESAAAGEFAPGQDADYYAEEDEDGRFYGGGLSATQKQVLNIMDSAPGQEGVDHLPGEDMTAASVRKQLLSLEKAVNKNRDLRTKYPTDPEKFVDSEYNVLEAIRALLLFSTAPALTYPILLENATPSTFADLLSHENTDVPVAVVETLEEWVDPEGLEDDDADDEDGEAAEQKREATKKLVDGLVAEGVLDLVVAQLSRLNEEDEGERAGVFHVLGLVENLLTLSPTLATPLLSPTSPLLGWLITRLSQSNKPTEYDQNRWYAAEMLALVLSLPTEVVKGVDEARMRVGEEDGVDALLKVLSVYRKRDPASGDETEFMENIFDALCSCLSSAVPARVNTSTLAPVPHPVKAAFLEGEGVELLVLMLKAKNLARSRAIKALDHALQGRAGEKLCERFVEVLGLKTLFAIFMGKGSSKKAASVAALTHEDIEHILSLLSSLFSSLASDSPARIRLIAKFVEGDYEKVDRLSEVRDELETRLTKGIPPALAAQLDDDELYLEKLENGLFALQLADYVAAWVCMEDDGARDHLKMLLARQDKSLRDLVVVLDEYRDNIGDLGAPEPENGEEQPDRPPTEGDERRAILEQLAGYLQSVA
ncbi:hypothetical protein JCM10207_000372 [Rhodosporidiobolus poonsookiae]